MNQGDILVGEASFVGEFAKALFGEPRRHVTALGDLRDQLRAFLNVRESEKRERGGLTRVVARSAMVQNDRGDVAVKRDRTWCGAAPAPRSVVAGAAGLKPPRQ